MPEPHLRTGDTDRAAVATVLGRHMAEGRLTVAEYDAPGARCCSRTPSVAVTGRGRDGTPDA
jgi:hypothetical protein